MNRLSTRVRPQSQGKQISETEGSLNVEPIIRLRADANCECCRGKTLQCFTRARERRIGLAELRLEPKMHAGLVTNFDHASQRLIESGLYPPDYRILGFVREVGRVKIGEVVILNPIVSGRPVR